jgi:hypothetical protein
MADSVFQQMADKAPALLEKIATNPDLCNVVLGLLARCIVLSQQRGLPIEGIEIGELNSQNAMNNDGIFRAKVTFRRVALTRPAMWPLQSDFARYVRAKAHGLGMALQSNPSLNDFFQRLVEGLDRYCTLQSIQFGALVVKQSIISNPGDMLVLKVGKKLLD